jgi:hypothetical protein
VDRSADAEARQCLDHLLSHDLPWRDPDDRERSTTGRITVRELLELALRRGAPDAPEALGRLGLKADPERGVLVVNSGASIEPIFRGSKWSQGAHRARLLELAGAEPVASPPRFPVLGSRRCVSVPWDLVDLDGPEQLAA